MMKKAKSPAAMVAAELKRRFKKELGLKVTWSRSEYYAGGCSVNIDIENPRPAEFAAAKAMSWDYVCGNFNGMEDIYEIKPGFDFEKPHCDYVFVNPRYTDEVMAAAKEYAEKYGVLDASFREPCAWKALTLDRFWEFYDYAYNSVLEAKMAGDDAAADKMFDKAKTGEVIRLI